MIHHRRQEQSNRINRLTRLISLAAVRFILFFTILVFTTGAGAAPPSPAESTPRYLLMKPIEKAFLSGNFDAFQHICEKKISLNFDPPLEIHGYVLLDKIIYDLNRMFQPFDTQSLDWVSRQLEEHFSVQSVNLVLKNKESEKSFRYKFIFFLIKKNKEWKIYYLRGLKI